MNLRFRLPTALSSSLVIAALAPTFAASSARAFGEDICYLKTGGLAQCVPLTFGCQPGEYSTKCEATTLAASLSMGLRRTSGRSMIHMDATYLMARAVGFDANSAYWIAAYDQAEDLGRYVPADKQGIPIVDVTTCDAANPPANCRYVTEDVGGVTRMSMPTGGTLYHFVVPSGGHQHGAVEGVDGLHPDVEDAETEGFLNHMRAWAFGGDLLCTGGVTTQSADGDYALGETCFEHADGSAGTIAGAISAIATFKIPFAFATGPQVISRLDDQEVTGDSFDDYVGAAIAPFARFGLYLHTYQDRISHHVCTDGSVESGPWTKGPDFLVNLASPECAQGLHFLRHAFEVGVRQSLLTAADRTMPAGIEGTYDELLAFAKARGVARPEAQLPARRAALTASIVAVLEVPEPAKRQDAMIQLGCALGIEPSPGLGSCSARTSR